MAEETKQDILLKRTQLVLATLAALIGIIVGIYQFRKVSKPEPPPPPPVQQAPAGGEMRSALEEAGASWIRKLAKAKEE